jgi:predicted 3-demethylubiquinone-9 3-methyltransferase (glyoxalase superfamily)
VSFQITCADQAEADHYWDALTADGGEESQCGWLKDRFGLSWQVVPAGLDVLLSDPDPARAQRAMQAMLGMRRIDIAAVARAADGA